MRGQNRALAGVAVALLLIASEGWAQRTELKPGINLFSKQQEIQLGQEAETEARKNLQLVNDPTLNNYIQQLGRKLVRYSPAPDYPYSFHVVRDKSINAFALPGGPVYVNTGTIAAADNEDQLAGVIAHEMTHIAMRHATNQASKKMALEMPLAILGGMAGGSAAGQLAQLGIGFGANTVMLKYSRSAEEQADIGAAHTMYDAGYDPEQLGRFFQKLQEEGGSRSFQFLSDHPNPGNRVQKIALEDQRMGAAPRAPHVNAQFEQAKAIAERLNNQSSSGSGSRRGGSSQQAQPGGGSRGRRQAPSRQFSSYNGGPFEIRYPSNWNVYGEGTSSLTITDPDGLVQTGNENGLAYGAMVSTYEPEGGTARSNASSAVSDLLAQLRRGNPDMRITSGQQPITVSGRKGSQVTMTNRSPVSSQEVDWLVAVPQSDGTLWYVVFVAPQGDFQNLRPTFQQMLDSVRFQQ